MSCNTQIIYNDDTEAWELQLNVGTETEPSWMHSEFFNTKKSAELAEEDLKAMLKSVERH